MTKNIIKVVMIVIPLIASFNVVGCNNSNPPVPNEDQNSIEEAPTNEKLNNAWSTLVNENQNRMTLVPELLAVVRTPYDEEQRAFTHLQEVRAEIGGMHASAAMLDDSQKLSQYQDAQARLGVSIKQLIEVSNQYPLLTSDMVFQDLVAQIAGQEQKIALARNRYEQQGGNYDSLLVHYERRQDLASILPKVIKNHTYNNESVFTQVIATTSVIDSFDVSSNTPEDLQAVKRYLEAQANMDTTLSNLMRLSEHYTALKSNANFLRLQTELEEIDNRLMVARSVYNEEAQKR